MEIWFANRQTIIHSSNHLWFKVSKGVVATKPRKHNQSTIVEQNIVTQSVLKILTWI